MKPIDSLKKLIEIEKQLKLAAKGSVKVGVIESKSSGAIYDGGQTVTEIAASHEYGIGVPQRSFLRTPFLVKKKELTAFIEKQFDRVAIGKATAENALERIGIYATNLSKAAFRNKGYGQWQDIEDATKAAKGSSQILIDTGTLRNAITYEVDV